VPQQYHNSSLTPKPNETRAPSRARLWREDWNWLPLVVAVCGWCTTLALCRVMISRERAQVVQTATLAARNIQSKIMSSVSTHIAPLEALVARWSSDADPWLPEWESDAGQLQQQHPVFESVAWVDAANQVRWSVPVMKPMASAVQPAMQAARDTHRTTVITARNASDGDKTVLVLIPIFRRGFEGCVIASLRTEAWLQSTVDAQIPRGYAASVSDVNERIYARDLASAPNLRHYVSEASFNVYGLPWAVRVWPTPDEWAGSSKILFGLTLVIGLLIYVSGALAVAARRRTRTVEWAKHEVASRQEDLRQANERLEAVIQASPLAIVAMDLQSNVLSWNSSAERIFGWSGEEALGRPPLFIPAEQLEEFRTKIEGASSGEMIAGLERQRQRKDGTAVDVAIWTAPLKGTAGSIAGIIMAIADISEKKKLEEQLRHSQKMEAVGRLAGGVAHDFNNLLTIINGYGHMMLESFNPSDRLRTHAEQILKAGNQAAALTSQLLAFSRRQVIHPKPVDLNHVITNIEKMLRRVIGEDIVMHTVMSPELARVKADPNQVEQVLINLVANARDAMPRGGTLRIATENVTVAANEGGDLADIAPGPYVRLTVADTGEGMDADTKSHLFEPFFTTQERGKGTGLGLSSVYGSVRQNDGGISVWSERGKGTIFCIYLPQLADAAETDEKLPQRNGTCRGHETILLVEDEAPLRRMLREALANAGYQVLEANDGSDALRRWEQDARSIDLLLTDVVMPLLNGRELARRLAAAAPRMQVLYMSGYADDVIAYHGMLDAGTNLIQKPFLPDALLAKVREVLDARKPELDTPVGPARRYYQGAKAS
jgi:PAS domain S-box-containing protein